MTVDEHSLIILWCPKQARDSGKSSAHVQSLSVPLSLTLERYTFTRSTGQCGQPFNALARYKGLVWPMQLRHGFLNQWNPQLLASCLNKINIDKTMKMTDWFWISGAQSTVTVKRKTQVIKLQVNFRLTVHIFWQRVWWMQTWRCKLRKTQSNQTISL